MFTNTNTWVWYTVTFLVAGVFIFAFPHPASAQEIAGVICDLSTQLTGGTAKALATLAILGIGAMTLFGKSSWGTVFVTGAAIALVFGAGSVVTMIGGQVACNNQQPPFQFACNNGNAQGNLFTIDTLVQSPTQAQTQDSVFATTLFFFKNTVGQVMSAMYCTVSNAMVLPFQAALTLFIVVFGLAVTTGITNFTMKEAATALFKIALIWGFAMNATWGIGLGYRFFMNFAEEATNIVLGAIPRTGGVVPSITAPDAVITGIFGTTITGAQAAGTAGPSLATIPQVCILTLAIFAALLLFFMPFVIFFVAMLIAGYIGNFARALLNYLTSLVLISFLFIFAPFFVSFALFRTTMPLFESWLKHLISFSLQMVVMFAFMAMLSLLPVAGFFTMILSLLKEYNKTFDFPTTGVPLVSYTMHWCGVCQFAINQNSNFSTDQNIADIACVLHRGATAAQAAATAPGYMLSVDGNFFVISLWNLVEHTDLAKYLIIQVLALWLISRAIGELMKRAPDLAKQLGGLASAAALGGGGSGAKGVGIGYIGMDSIQAGFLGMRNGLLRGGVTKRDWAGRMRAGIMGTEKVVTRNADGTTTTEVKRLANTGLFKSVKEGAYNERSLEGKEFQNKIKRTEKRLDAMKGRTETVALISQLGQEEQAANAANQKLQAKINAKQAAMDKEPDVKKREALYNEKLSLQQTLDQQKQDQQRKLGKLREEFTKSEKKVDKHDRATNEAIRLHKELEVSRQQGMQTPELAAKQAQLDKTVTKVRKKEDEADVIEMERYLNSMKQQGAGGFKKGLKEVRDEHGLVIHKSSLSNPDYDNQTTKKEQELAQKHRTKVIYGAPEKENPNNKFFFMEMPQDVYTGPHRKTMDEFRSHADTMIGNERARLQQKLEAGSITPGKKAELEQALHVAESHAKNAQSAGQIKHVIKDITKIETRIKKFETSAEPAATSAPAAATANIPPQQQAVPAGAPATTQQGPLNIYGNNPAPEAVPVPVGAAAASGQTYAGSQWGSPPAPSGYGSSSGRSPSPPAAGSDGANALPSGNAAPPSYGQVPSVAKGGDGAYAQPYGGGAQPSHAPSTPAAPPASVPSGSSPASPAPLIPVNASYGSDPLGISSQMAPPSQSYAPASRQPEQSLPSWTTPNPPSQQPSPPSGHSWNNDPPSQQPSPPSGHSWNNDPPSQPPAQSWPSWTPEPATPAVPQTHASPAYGPDPLGLGSQTEPPPQQSHAPAEPAVAATPSSGSSGNADPWFNPATAQTPSGAAADTGASASDHGAFASAYTEQTIGGIPVSKIPAGEDLNQLWNDLNSSDPNRSRAAKKKIDQWK